MTSVLNNIIGLLTWDNKNVCGQPDFLYTDIYMVLIKFKDNKSYFQLVSCDFFCLILFKKSTIKLHTVKTWMTHICVGNLTIIGSDNGLSSDKHQAIIWTNAVILLIGPLGTNFSEISYAILIFPFKKMRLKVSTSKWQKFCLGLNVLRELCYTVPALNWPYHNGTTQYIAPEHAISNSAKWKMV